MGKTKSGKNLTITVKEGECKKKAYAKAVLSPYLRNANTSEYFSTAVGGKDQQDLDSTISEVVRRVTKVKDGDMTDIEATLVSQSISLDAIFNDMAYRAALNMGKHLPATETYMRMALKAQSQCRTTIEALNEMKNPRSITITKQANISDQQVVNNGTMNTGTHAGKNKNSPNELLEKIEHERLDTGKKGETIKANQDMETVGEVNGRKD